MVCSCDIRRVEGELVQSDCEHRDAVLRDDYLIGAVRNGISNEFSAPDRTGEDNRWFGSWVEVSGNSVIVDEEPEDNVICTQIDRIDGRSWTKRGV